MSLMFSCGFARVAVKESFHKAGRAQQETDPVQRWKNYCNMFDETARSISVSYTHLTLPTIYSV